MKKRILILYDFNGKTQTEKVQAIRKLYGYRDISNYNYQYNRNGELGKIKLSRSKKSVIQLDNEKDLANVAEILKVLKIKFEVAELQ